MKTFIILSVSLLVSIEFIYSQSSYTNVVIDNDNQNSPEEISICINPKNIDQLSAGANIDNYYYSSNGGVNWTSGWLTSTYSVWGDPALFVDTNGKVFYLHLTNPPGGLFIDRIVCQTSSDGGMNYDNGTFMGYNPPKQQDKPWGVVDFTHGPRGNWIYVTWTQFDSYGIPDPADSSNILFSRSTNGGATWSAPLRLNRKAGDCLDGDNTIEGAVPCVGSNGEIYVSWAGTLSLNSPKIFFTKSTDGGSTWLANNIIAGTQPGGWDYMINGLFRSNGLPVTCCDISSGPFRGTVYINYTDSAGPTDHDVKIIKSTDGGSTWSAPIRINDDPAGKEQFFTWLTIDQATGFLYDVFYDRRNYTNASTDVYIAHSSNGGATWINERISASPFTPNSQTFFGDYNNITAYNGRVRPVWTRLLGSSTSVWTALIDFPIGVNEYGNQIPEEYELYQNYPNPFNPDTKIMFDIPKQASGITTLKVYDQLGREIATLVNGDLNPGTYEINWDAADYATGVYFYKLQAGNFTETKKMVLAK